jgi:hypothetical protein
VVLPGERARAEEGEVRRWQYRQGLIKSVQSSDDLERELNAMGAEGWEIVDARRKERPIMSRRERGAVAFVDAFDWEFLFKREIES